VCIDSIELLIVDIHYSTDIIIVKYTYI